MTADAVQNNSNLWYSSGDVYDHEDPPTRGRADATVYYSSDGKLHWAELDDPQPGDNVLRLASRNLAVPTGTWTVGPSLQPYDRPWFASSGSTTYLVITHLGADGADRVELWRSLDGGSTWTHRSDITTLSNRVGNLPQVSPTTGDLLVPVSDVLGETISVYRSSNEVDWVSESVPGAVGVRSHAMSAVDSEGRLFLVWANNEFVNLNVRTPSGSWQGPWTVSATAAEPWGPSIVAPMAKVPVMAWLSKATGEDWKLRARWALVEDLPGGPAFGPEIVVDSRVSDSTAPPRDIFRDFITMAKKSDGTVVIGYNCNIAAAPLDCGSNGQEGKSHPRVRHPAVANPAAGRAWETLDAEPARMNTT